jgi:hypothetical protein
MPPTDPRFLEMTDEQIDMEFMHLHLDRKEAEAARKGNAGIESFYDPDYEAWEAKEREKAADWAAKQGQKPSESASDGEWVEVE